MSSIYDWGYKNIMGPAAQRSPTWNGVFCIVGSIAFCIFVYGLFWALPYHLRNAVSDIQADTAGLDVSKHAPSVERLLAFGEAVSVLIANVVMWVSHLATRSVFYWLWLGFVVCVPVYMIVRYFSEEAYTPNAAHY